MKPLWTVNDYHSDDVDLTKDNASYTTDKKWMTLGF
jgi:hypothetical protein